MKVYDAVANAFVKEGATTIFGLLGDGQLTWWASMAKHPEVRLIDAREEGAGLAMAEGYARASGQVGVCSVTHGPGLARLSLSLIAAARSRTPIVVHTATTTFNDERETQYLNQDRFVAASEAGYIEVMRPDYAEDAVRQAFYRARRESRPIVLSIPMDVQGKECESEGEDYVPSTALSGGQQRIRPARDRVQEAVRIISEAKRPVIVLGRGAKDPQAREAADRLGKRVGALIASTLYAKGTLNDSEWYTGVSGLFSSRAAMALFQEADCVIAIGAGMNIRTMGGGYTYPDARIVHIDVQPHVLLGTERGADCYVQGDATETAQEIEAMLAQQGVQRDGFRTAATKNALRGSFRDPGEFEIEPGTVDIREVLTVLDDKLPSSVGLVTGSAHNFSFPVWHMQKPRALQVSVTAFTGVGQVIGNAIGAAVGWKDPVVAVDGDGSALQNIQELDTAGRLGVKLLYFIVNDEAYGAEYHKLRAKGLDGNLSAVPTPDFGALARVFGCRGRQARTVDEVAAGIDEFLAGDGPMVLDVRISRNVISIPYRRLHFGQDV
ncbi:MAG TPA: thiamine pyrophosphate-binding protein [Burkholderiales bacterium]|nr:thiamine pyrophosphate-binding protein [Burkholderiales bacterium]